MADTQVLVLHGPNLNLLGQREIGVYGTTTMEEIDRRLRDLAAEIHAELRIHQSNHEGELVDLIQDARAWAHAIVLNPGAFTHTSVALRDAMLAVGIPFIELHLSNTFAREEFRQSSYFSDIAVSCLFGFGAYGYELALMAADKHVAVREGD